ncbi:hypothetical protein M514_21753 [Trichuris suis]|uniref:Uncharacterized protein n=1 Tax=Trichuris suis TaxID=68888 RepID=A0A085N9D1_9BILA|nr:hypothetical protein M514_21753 [Trichuris suis]
MVPLLVNESAINIRRKVNAYGRSHAHLTRIKGREKVSFGMKVTKCQSSLDISTILRMSIKSCGK